MRLARDGFEHAWVEERLSQSAAKGAETPVWLATLPDDGPTGGFFS